MSAYATVYRAQCRTFAEYRAMHGLPDGALATPTDHPVLLLRLLPAYRTPESLAMRKALADRMRAVRAA